MSELPVADDPRAALLAVYDSALPHVYGYLLGRCGTTALAEELTADTFLAAVAAVRQDRPPPISVSWLVGVARHKLVDHWRRQAREQRLLHAVAADPSIVGDIHDPWDERLDAWHAQAVLDRLAPQHRQVLTLRYLDDLPVSEVARLLDRTVQVTEGLLVRARAAFRRGYRESREEGATDA